MTPITRYRIDYDPETTFEECNGQSRPLTETEYQEHSYLKDGQPISYEDYLNYYGNPSRHVYFYIEREDRCPLCNTYHVVDAVYGIDFMDDDIEADYVGTYTLDQLPGYLHELAESLSAR